MVWRLAFGVWRLAFGVWRSAFGVRSRSTTQTGGEPHSAFRYRRRYLDARRLSTESRVSRGSLERAISHETCNFTPRGSVFGASRLWHVKRCAHSWVEDTPRPNNPECIFRPRTLPIINPDHAIRQIWVTKMWPLNTPRDLESPGHNPLFCRRFAGQFLADAASSISSGIPELPAIPS